MCARPFERGVTLLELVLAIAVIGIALASILSVFTVTAQHSADPMARQQAQLVAETYLDEILIKRFYDPDTNTVCPALEATRGEYDNVCDYRSINEAPTDQFGTPIGALSAYNVAVSVTRDGTVSLNGIDNTGAIRVILVTVTVSGPNDTSITLNGYRTNYECNLAADPECKPEI